MDNLFILICIILLILGIIVLILNRSDDTVKVKSGKAVDNYDYIKYFKEDRNRLQAVEKKLLQKPNSKFRVRVNYTSPTRKSVRNKTIIICRKELDYIQSNPAVIMSAAEYNQIIRAQKQIEKDRLKEEKQAERERVRAEKEALKAEQQTMLERKRYEYYEKLNAIIDYSNTYKDSLVIKEDKYELDRLISNLYDKTYNAIKKIKTVDSGEWKMLDIPIASIYEDVKKVVERNLRILNYYDSPEFKQIYDTCNSLMDSQREFNEYIEEKAKSIASLFGSQIVRAETENDFKQNYVRPYKKTITPFTMEVTKSVFSSAENDPMEYIVKKFYPNKNAYPEQIRKLRLLIGEIETLKDAKTIIDNYKKDYQQYLSDVPAYVMENDEDGFYARLGFANISEKALTIEYRFSYTSDGGMVQKSFPVPMTEDTIIALIDKLESKLTMEAFTSEQRALMTPKLRNYIKERDGYTCKICGNSAYKEPNLLLEIDHILPVSKGGQTIESNLQTLCWKCNRAKSSKIV